MDTSNHLSLAEPRDQHCRQCGTQMTSDELAAGLCERCEEEERNNNFVDVEVATWQEQEDEANENEL